MIVATVIREIGEQRVARGRFLRLPDGCELQIARVTLVTRLPPTSEPRFTPGWKAAEAVARAARGGAKPANEGTMTDSDLERLLRHVALPPMKLGVRVQRLEARRTDPKARRLAEAELRLASMIRTRLARAGWWN